METMNPQPIPQPIAIDRKKELAAARRRAEFRADALYIGGAALVSLGMGMMRVNLGIIAAGAFSLLLPLLELATGFIRGLRKP